MLVKYKETCMQSKLSIGPKFGGRVRKMMVRESIKNGYSLEMSPILTRVRKDFFGEPRMLQLEFPVSQTSEKDDLVLAGILAVLKGSDHPQSFTLPPDKAAIALKKLGDMVRFKMPDTSKGAKFFRGDGHFTIVPVDARPGQLAIVYEFPENAAMFYNA